MRKSAMKSSTTQTVAVAGSATGAALSIPVLLQQLFPDVPFFSDPSFIVITNFVMTTIALPFLSRAIARLRGK
jgi:hypothetical protein